MGRPSISRLIITFEAKSSGWLDLKLSFDERLQFPIENSRSVDALVAASKIFDQLVGVQDVRSDLGSPGSRLVFALDRSDLTSSLGLLNLPNFGSKDPHGVFFVLQLRTLRLDRDHDPGWQMSDPHSGIDLINILTARPGRAESIDLQIISSYHDLAGFFDNWHNLNQSKRRLAQLISVKGRLADQAVRPGLFFEITIGVTPGDLDHG